MAKEIARKTDETTNAGLRLTPKENLANAIFSCTYTELMEIGTEMSEVAQRRKRLESKEEFAALLHYWASQAQ